MHALVTGAGGFLGRYIAEALVARGDRVRGLARGAYPELAATGVEMVRGDVRDRDAVAAACAGIDCAFHVAAVAGIGVLRHEFEETNVRGTQHVLDACRKHGVGRLVFTSSPSVVFAGRDQAGVDESAAYNFQWMERNRAWYSLSKARAEELVLAANSATLKTCALRPHLVWGPRDSHLVPRLLDRARSGRLRRVGDGTNLIDITYVENAAEAHVRAADALASPVAAATSPAGKAYFITQGEPVNCWQWIEELLALAKLPPVRKSISLATARRVGWACEVVWRTARLRSEPPMTRFLASQLATSHWFDISAARRDLGYQPRISTAEGMRRLGQWLDPPRQSASGTGTH